MTKRTNSLTILACILGACLGLCEPAWAQITPPGPRPGTSDFAGLLYASNFGQWSAPQPNLGQYSWNKAAACQPTAGGTIFNAFTVGSPVTLIDLDTPSHNEVVTPTSVTIVPAVGQPNLNPGSCSISIAPVYGHNHYYFKTATAGLQEAINWALAGAYQVILTPDWTALGGVTGTITSASGNASVTIEDQRNPCLIAYLWGGSSYIAQPSSCSGGGGSGTLTGSVSPYFVPYSNGADNLVNSPAFWSADGVSSFTLPATSGITLITPQTEIIGTAGVAAGAGLTEGTSGLICSAGTDCFWADSGTNALMMNNNGSGRQYIVGAAGLSTGFFPIASAPGSLINSDVDQDETTVGQITIGAGEGFTANQVMVIPLGTATSGNNLASNKVIYESSGFNQGLQLTNITFGSGYTPGQKYGCSQSGGTFTVQAQCVAVGSITGGLNVNYSISGIYTVVPGSPPTITGSPGSGWTATPVIADAAVTQQFQTFSQYVGGTPDLQQPIYTILAPSHAATSGVPAVQMEWQPVQGSQTAHIFNLDGCFGCMATESMSEMSGARTYNWPDASGTIAVFSGTPTNGDCANWNVTAGVATLGDVACGGSGSTPVYPLVQVQTAYPGGTLGAKIVACLADATVIFPNGCDASTAVWADTATGTAWSTTGSTITITGIQNSVPAADTVYITFGTTSALTGDYTVTSRTATTITAASSHSASSGTEAIQMVPTLGTLPIEVARNAPQILKFPAGGVVYSELAAATVSVPSAPTVTPVTGTGSLPAATYSVSIAPRTGGSHPSLASSATTAVLTATGELQVAIPSCPTYVAGYDVFMAVSGSRTLMGNGPCGGTFTYSYNALFPANPVEPASASGVPAIILYNRNHPQMYAESGDNGGFTIRNTSAFAGADIIAAVGKGYSTINNVGAYNYAHINLAGPTCYDEGTFFQSQRNNDGCVGTGGSSGNPAIGYEIAAPANDLQYNNLNTSCQDTYCTALAIVKLPSIDGDTEGGGRLFITGSAQSFSSSTLPVVTIAGLNSGATGGSGGVNGSWNGGGLGLVQFSTFSMEGTEQSSCMTLQDVSQVNIIGANCTSNGYSGGGTTKAYTIASTNPTAGEYLTNTINIIGSSTQGFNAIYSNSINGDSVTVANNNYPYTGDYHYGGGQLPTDVWQGRPVLSDSTLTLSATDALILSQMTGTQCLHEVSGVIRATGSDCSSGSGGTTVQIDGASTTSPLNINSTSPAVDPGFVAATWKYSAGSAIAEVPTTFSTPTTYIVYGDSLALVSLNSCLLTSTSSLGPSTSWSIASNVVTFTGTNNYAAGDIVAAQSPTFPGNGQQLTVLSAGLSGTSWSANYTHANASATETGTADCYANLSGDLRQQPFVSKTGSTVINEAQGGNTTANLVSSYNADVHPHTFAVTGLSCVLVTLMGSQDAYSSVAYTTTIPNIQSIWASAHTDGCSVMAITMPPLDAYTAPNSQANWQNTNDFIAQNGPQTTAANVPTATGGYWDFKVDAAQILGPYLDTYTRLAGNPHLSDQGNWLVATGINTALSALGSNSTAQFACYFYTNCISTVEPAGISASITMSGNANFLITTDPGRAGLGQINTGNHPTFTLVDNSQSGGIDGTFEVQQAASAYGYNEATIFRGLLDNGWNAPYMDVEANSSTQVNIVFDTGAEVGFTPTNIHAAFAPPDTGFSRINPNVMALGNGTWQDTTGALLLGQVQAGRLYSAAGTPLPTCNSGLNGTRAAVSDATAPLYMTAYTSGGAITAEVICSYNGSAYTWLTH